MGKDSEPLRSGKGRALNVKVAQTCLALHVSHQFTHFAVTDGGKDHEDKMAEDGKYVPDPRVHPLGQTQISPNILRNMPCRLGERNFPKYPLSGGWSSTRPPKTEPPSPSFYDLEVGNVQFSSPAAR